MGMPASSVPYYRVDDVLAIPDDGNRYELAYGELLVSPAPSFRHQVVVSRLFRLLADYCDRERLGVALVSPADLTWGRTDVLTQPDVFVVSGEYDATASWSDIRNVPLVAEVLSPSTKGHDRFRKRRVYQDHNVDVYWIIDPDEKVAEVWTPRLQFPVVERESLRWHPAGASAPLVITLKSLWK
jgi:Uma2 family endonuclease